MRAGTRPADPGRAQETTKLGITGRCMHADAAAAGRTSAAQVGVGKPIQFLLVSDTRCGPFRGCMALPILYCILPSHIPTAQQTETLLIPDDETVELAPLRRFRKHATMCRSKRRGTEARPACMYCARVDRAFRSAQLCRAVPCRAVTMACGTTVRGRGRWERCHGFTL